MPILTPRGSVSIRARLPAVNFVPPQISGTPSSGSTLTIDLGSWLNADKLTGSLRYLSDDTELQTYIDDGTYNVQVADRDEFLYLRVVPNGNESLAVNSIPFLIYAPVVSTVAPEIIGNQGSLLTYVPGTHTGTQVLVTPQWESDGVDIPGATGNTLNSDPYKHTHITLYEVLSNVIGTVNSADSNSISPLPLFTTGETLANAAADTAFTRTIVANDAETLEIVSGTLPTGTTFTDNTDGTADIEATTTDAANISITVRATNDQGAYTDQVYTLRIALAATAITTPADLDALTAAPDEIIVSAVDDAETYQFQIASIEDINFASVILNIEQAGTTLDTGIPAMAEMTAYRIRSRPRAVTANLLEGAWSPTVCIVIRNLTTQVEFATADASPVASPYAGEVGTLESVDTTPKAEVVSGEYHVPASSGTSTAIGHSASPGARRSGNVIAFKYRRISGTGVIRAAATLAAATAATSSRHSVNLTDGSIGEIATSVSAPAIGSTLQTNTYGWKVELDPGWAFFTAVDNDPDNIQLYWLSELGTDVDNRDQFNVGGTAEWFLDFWREQQLPAEEDWETFFRSLDITTPVVNTLYSMTDDDGMRFVKFTLPGTPATGDSLELRQGTTSTYYIVRLYYNGTTWELRTRSVNNNAAEVTIGTDVADVGTPDTLIIWKKGNSRSTYTRVGAAAPVRRVANGSSTIGSTSLELRLVSVGSWTLNNLISYPMQSSKYARLAMLTEPFLIDVATFDPAASVPQNTVLPVFVGSVAHVGAALTITPGTWVGGTPSVTRKVFSNGVDRGTVTTTYTPVIGDLGTTLTIVESESVSDTEATSLGLVVTQWDAPVISSHDDQEEVYTYTPTLVHNAIAGFAGTYEREVRTTFSGVPTKTGLAGVSNALDETIDNLSDMQVRFRAGEGGAWSTPITLKFHVPGFLDRSSTDQAAPISSHAADVVGNITVTKTPASVSRSGGKTKINVAVSGAGAYVWTSAAFARSHNRIFKSIVNTLNEQDSRVGLHGSQVTAPLWNGLEMGAKVGLPATMNDNGTTVTVAAHNTNGYVGDQRAFIALPDDADTDGGFAYFWHSTDDLAWHFGGIGFRGTTSPLYFLLGGISGTGHTMDIDEAEVIDITSGYFSQPFDWAKVWTKTPLKDTIYAGVSNGMPFAVRFILPSSGTVRVAYRRFASDSYRYLEYNAATNTVVAKMNVNGVETNYTSPVSIGSIGSAGDSVTMLAYAYNNREYYHVFNHTSGIYKSANNTSNQSFNNNNSDVMITGTATVTLTSLLIIENTADHYSVLDLNSEAQTGFFMEMAVNQQQRTFVDSVSGHQYLVLAMRNANNTVDPIEMYMINLTTEVVDQERASLGRTSDTANLIWDQANQQLYGWTGDPSYFWRWQLGGSIQIVGAVPSPSSYFYKGVLSANGKVYIGTQGVPHQSTRLVEYNPATNLLTSLGTPSAGNFDLEWVYNIEANANFVFCGMGQSPWYLSIRDLGAGTFTRYFESENASSGQVRCNIARTVFYYKKIIAGVTTWYDITDGTPGIVGAPSEVTLQPLAHIGNTIPVPDQTDVVWDFSESNAYSGHAPVIGWTRSGESAQEVTLPMPKLAPADIKRIIDYDDENLLVQMEFYGPLVIYNKASGNKTVPGVPPYSLYGLVKISDTRFQFTGYPSVGDYDWETEDPWTSNGGVAADDVDIVNPRRVFVAGTHGYFIIMGSDGDSYIASEYERDSLGGELTRLDNSDDTVTRESLSGEQGEAVPKWNPRGLAQAGTRIIYSGVGTDTEAGDDAKLFVYTLAGFPTIENEWSITGKTDLGFLIAINSTEVIGMVAGSTYVYRMNIVTGTLVDSDDLAGTIFGDGFWYDFRPFWDGTKIWFSMKVGAQNALYTLDPATLIATKVIDTTAAINVHISDGVAHEYNGKRKYEYPV